MPGIAARITAVTLYTAGALVRRVATVDATLKRVRIDGLPRAVITDTLRVEVVGPSVAVALVAGRDAPRSDAAAPESVPALRSAERSVALAEAELARLESALSSLAAAPVVASPPTDEPPADWELVLAARRALVAARAEREVALRAQCAAARQRVVEARRELAAEQDRVARTSGDRAPKLHELRTYVEVVLEPAAGATGTIELVVEYLVAAARWVPSYVARLDGDQATIEVRALVAQAAGEDWTDVALVLSTAEPTRFSSLPELHAQRIGRRQQEPVKQGFRAPPVGAEALYADYDRSKPPPLGAHPEEMRAQVWDEESSRAKDAFQTPPRGHALPPAEEAAPARLLAKRDADAPERMSRARVAVGGSGPPPGAPPPAPQATKSMPSDDGMAFGGAPAPPSMAAPAMPAPALAAPTARLDYGNLRMAPPSSPQRGRLVPGERTDDPVGAAEVAAAAARLAALAVPAGCHAEWSHAYDFAFAADGRVDLAADGAWHSIAVTARPTTVQLRHVATPREQQDVFRIATLANPFDGPLLPAPIDIYDQGRFLLTSTVELTPPGGQVEVGLGVDAAVKIARNTEFQEEVTGMLRGGLRLHHAITIDVENLSARSIDLEVRERVPVIRDGEDEIEVSIGRVEPAWERFTPDPAAPREPKLRGGHRWRVKLPPGKRQALRAGYEIKIAGKHELVGGNRRES